MDSNPRRLRLYLVEDSPIVLALLRELLADEAGIECVGHSRDAPAAIADIARLDPDAIILDIALKDGTGFDVLRSLPPPGTPRPVVLVLSNFALPRYRDEAKRLGADHYFDKSHEIVALLGVVVAMAKRVGGA
jgi:DNA-binding NarL/FixJ family response regulator